MTVLLLVQDQYMPVAHSSGHLHVYLAVRWMQHQALQAYASRL